MGSEMCIRDRTWSYLHRPRPWREFHHCFGAGGAVSSIAGRQHGSKSAGSSATWECYWCGQRGHFARNCMAPFPVASGGEQGQSSAARQQRPPKKGNNRGHRGAGRGGSSEGRGSSRSTFAQQQHQKNNPGSSGSGSGGAAPQRTVQVDTSSTTASAPVAVPAVPSAACLLYTSPSPRDGLLSRMPSSA